MFLKHVRQNKFIHVFGAWAALWLVIQLNWMFQRQNYADRIPRLASAPAVAIVLCFLYSLLLKTASRMFFVSPDVLFSKAKSIFPLFYLNAMLLFFPYAVENILFFEFVFFLAFHLYLLASLTPFSAAEKGCTFLLFLLVTLCMAEGTLRAYNRISPSFMFSSCSYKRFKSKPHSYHFNFKLNSGGYNDVEFAVKKKSGTFRVVALGDSFAFGLVPYRYNFLTVLENLFKAGGQRIEIYNMGIYGTALDDYYNLLRQEALTFKPDMILCHFNVGNDIENYYASSSYRMDNMFHYKEWFLYKLLRYILRVKPRFKGRIIRGQAKYNDKEPLMSREDFMTVKLQRCVVFDKNADIRSWYQSAEEILVKMQKQAENAHAAFVVVLIPDELQYNPALQKEFIAAARARRFEEIVRHEPAFEFNLPQEPLTAFLRGRNMAYVNLLPVFKKNMGSHSLNIPNDNHWNIAGNKLAAETLYAELKSKVDAKQ